MACGRMKMTCERLKQIINAKELDGKDLMVTELNEVGKAVVVLTALVALSVRGEKCVIHLPERVTAEEVAALYAATLKARGR